MAVEFNDEFLRSLEQGWKVPVGVSEDEQVRAVMAQMREQGLDPNRAGVLRLVRDVNRSLASGDVDAE
ncbi:hypothetical protein [Gulosibacter hominis]|uniref:hypothetical protein n=1 Tax=Gulosibacter hominis TaxID=2770504 RepID=UPI001917D4B6|nr:hypothetical protein [Gulosibacter hominis]